MEDSIHVFDKRLSDIDIAELEKRYRQHFETNLEKMYGIHYSEETLAKWWPNSNYSDEIIYAKELSHAD